MKSPSKLFKTFTTLSLGGIGAGGCPKGDRLVDRGGRLDGGEGPPTERELRESRTNIRISLVANTNEVDEDGEGVVLDTGRVREDVERAEQTK